MIHMTFINAIRSAIAEEMTRNKTLFYLLDNQFEVNDYTFTTALRGEFDAQRVLTLPNCDHSLVGYGAGLCMEGAGVIINLEAHSLYDILSQLVETVLKPTLTLRETCKMAMVLRLKLNNDPPAGPCMENGIENLLCHFQDLRIVYPSTPLDAKALLKSALRTQCVTVFIENASLYTKTGPVSEEKDFLMPIGSCDIKKEGSDLSIFTYGAMLQTALAAAETLEDEGIHAQVIDLRTLSPLDNDTIIECAAKTGRILIVSEAHENCHVCAHVCKVICEAQAFDYLKAPIKTLGRKEMLIPYALTHPDDDRNMQQQNIIQTAHTLIAY